jgi:hypothetical protein
VATTRVEAAATGAEVVAAGRRKPEGHWGGGMEGAGRRSDQRGLSAGSAGGDWAQGQRIAVVVASFIHGGIRDLGRMVHGTGEATLTLGGGKCTHKKPEILPRTVQNSNKQYCYSASLHPPCLRSSFATGS